MAIESSTDLRRHLQDCVGGRDRETAFRMIADHLSGLICHSALRLSGDRTMAEEATQNVLLEISRKAGRLSKHPEILAWVHEATRLEVLQMRRADARRKKREETARETYRIGGYAALEDLVERSRKAGNFDNLLDSRELEEAFRSQE